MKNKEIKQENDLHVEIIKGVKILRDTVTCTMGVNGANVIIEPENGGFHRVTKDGVSVADSIKLGTGFANMGISMIIDAALSTMKKVGDGTTTTTLLASDLYLSLFDENGFRLMPLIKMKTNLDSELEFVKRELEKLKKTDVNRDIYKSIASLSANNDEKIGDLVADVYEKIGKDSIVKLDMSDDSYETRVVIEDGFVVEAGFVHRFFANNKNKWTYQEPAIFVTDHEMDTLSKLKNVVTTGITVVFANKFTEEFISSCVETYRQKNVVIVPIVVPSVDGVLDDICAISGCELFDKIKHPSFSDVNSEEMIKRFVGGCKELTLDHETTILKGGYGNELDVLEHNNHIDALIDKITTKSIKAKLKKRKAKLNGKIATIVVGGETETERSYVYDVLDDSIKATESCIKDGYVIGGGLTYLHLAEKLNQNFEESILSNILESPFRKLCYNSDICDDDVERLLGEISKSGFKNGVDFSSDLSITQCLETKGVVEPYNLILSCIENAVSVTKLLASSKAGIALVSEPQQK
jgi:chaperonin GroEL